MTLTYLTYLEQPGGVYEGQVIDVCANFEKAHGVPVQLVAVLSARDFEAQREKLLARAPGAIGIRSWFGWRAWPLARRMLRGRVARTVPQGGAILARGVVAARLALDLKAAGRVGRVVYDGRGAVSAEWTEYNVAPDEVWKTRIRGLERAAVLESDARIAVSQALVDYWRETFGYKGDAHVVIPCTLSAHHIAKVPNAGEIARRRAALGVAPDHTVICYAGSQAEWQSITKLDPWLDAMLEREPKASLLMMTRADLSGMQVVSNHAERIHQTWVTPDKVSETMQLADFGLLVRDRTVTNRVAAPTKFGEYLAAGLQVMISPEVGDYSKMVEDNGLGVVCDLTDPPPELAPLLAAPKRSQLAAFAESHFTKPAHYDSYAALLARLGVGSTTPVAANRN